MNLTRKENKNHYDKMEELKSKLGISFKNTKLYDKQELINLFLQDENLNNIPLNEFNGYYLWYKNNSLKIPISSSLTTSIVKHCLIYDFLEVTPIF